MLLRGTDVHRIHSDYQVVDHFFSENSPRKNYFLAACSYLDPNIDLEFINDTCPYGGIIGVGDSNMEQIFKRFKVFRIHAVLHDACGYMRSCHSIGPGYSYVLPCKFNNCFLGHLTGLSFCLYLKFFKSNLYHVLEC